MVKMVLSAGPAQFGLDLSNIEDSIDGNVILSQPVCGCKWPLSNRALINGKIAIVERGDCMFIDKARNIQKAGGIGVIVIDNVAQSSSKSSPIFAMSGDGHDDVDIPVVFLYWEDGQILLSAIREYPNIIISLSVQTINETEHKNFVDQSQSELDFSDKDSDSIIRSSDSDESLGKTRGVAHIKDVTEDVIANTEAIDIDKVLNLLNIDISKKYSDYVNKNLKNVDNKIIEDIWNSVFKSTVKTMQHVLDSHHYKNVEPIVQQVFKSSETFSDVKKTISYWIDFLKEENSFCINPLINSNTFKKLVLYPNICPIIGL
jgi:hypothetical protein